MASDTKKSVVPNSKYGLPSSENNLGRATEKLDNKFPCNRQVGILGHKEEYPAHQTMVLIINFCTPYSKRQWIL